MNARILSVLGSLLLLVPLSVGADSGGGNGGGGSEALGNKQVNPQQVTADYEVGYRQLKEGNYKAAIKSFKRVIDAKPDHAMAYNNMAYSYRKLGQFKRAIPLYEKALAITPDLPEAHEYIGEAFVALGRIDEAKKHLAILEKLDPKLAEDLREEIARHNRS
jgi:tetratricopeptide (TPR) repeat protein